ncbi:uncharacterized protein LOC143741411 [Siphateles boraxobius]|uniref:uncharacterized protein LOC143741411 n=1 Tax=Siphateles boraxobius TaxID=180520 RepID=UPI00406442B1
MFLLILNRSYIHPKGSFQSQGPFYTASLPLYKERRTIVLLEKSYFTGRVIAEAMFSPTHNTDPVEFTAPTQESLYLIVAFDEGASGPVAREWFTGKYDGGMAWWPPYKDSFKILQSILKRTSPNPSKGWKQYSCRILHETNCFESLSKRWGLSCHTSDLNTDKEELPVSRQRRNSLHATLFQGSFRGLAIGAEYDGLGSPEMPQDEDTPSDEGMFSPELTVNTNMPQCRETPLSRPGLPHRTPQSQRFVRSAPAGCTAVERLLLEQVGELQLKMDHVIKLLQKNNSIPHEDFNLNMLPLLTLQDLENFEDKLRTNSTFKKKVVCPVCVYL